MKKKTGAMTRIVVCEDERIVALDLRAFLQKNGFEVPALYDSAEDLLLGVEAMQPDLVLMDIHLSGEMDGIEAGAILFERWGIPVIFLTAYADGPTIDRARLTHPYAYILKPYDERELKTAISIGLYRASMERKLRMSESRYRGLFEAGLAAAFLIDKTGRILESNKAFSRLAPGIASIGELFHEEALKRSLFEAIGTGLVFGPLRIQVRTEEGREAWALLVAAPMELPDGSSAYQGQAIDITERKMLLDQLVHAQKLSALGRFAGGVAHDFNNVLTAVLGYASLLRSDLEAEGHGLEEVEGIEQAARRAAALARQLLMFSRRDATEASVFSLSGLVHDIEKMLRRVIGEGAVLTVRTEDGPDLVMADKSSMEQAVVNLVANSRDAMPSGGRIIVTSGVMRIDDGSCTEDGQVPAGTWSFVEVLDEGTGIPPEIARKVFEPFFTTKAPDKGTGLGLSTVASIVRQAEGHIQLSSTPGRGTTIRLLFPVASGASTAGQDVAGQRQGSASSDRGRSDGSTPNPRGKGRVVLVVENDSSVLTILEALLDKAGYRVMPAGHPGEALLLAENAESIPDILVADMAMPLMTGLELAVRLRGTLPGMPALFLRSRDGNPAEDAVSGAMTCLESCIDKPFTEEDLLDALDALLGNNS